MSRISVFKCSSVQSSAEICQVESVSFGGLSGTVTTDSLQFGLHHTRWLIFGLGRGTVRPEV